MYKSSLQNCLNKRKDPCKNYLLGSTLLVSNFQNCNLGNTIWTFRYCCASYVNTSFDDYGFYIMGLGANVRMREVASRASRCANFHYDIFSGHIQYLRHTVSIGNRFPWLYINFFQSSWFRCIIIESCIFPWWVSRRTGGCMFLKKGGTDTPFCTMSISAHGFMEALNEGKQPPKRIMF